MRAVKFKFIFYKINLIAFLIQDLNRNFENESNCGDLPLVYFLELCGQVIYNWLKKIKLYPQITQAEQVLGKKNLNN